MEPDLWKFEKEARTLGYSIIAGVDEAGRGQFMDDQFTRPMTPVTKQGHEPIGLLKMLASDLLE